MPRKNKNGEIIFKDYPEFRPNLTPREIFKAGSFEVEHTGDQYIHLLQIKNIKIFIKNIHNHGGKAFQKII